LPVLPEHERIHGRVGRRRLGGAVGAAAAARRNRFGFGAGEPGREAEEESSCRVYPVGSRTRVEAAGGGHADSASIKSQPSAQWSRDRTGLGNIFFTLTKKSFQFCIVWLIEAGKKFTWCSIVWIRDWCICDLQSTTHFASSCSSLASIHDPCFSFAEASIEDDVAMCPGNSKFWQRKGKLPCACGNNFTIRISDDFHSIFHS
jgi:hypothetical protein